MELLAYLDAGTGSIIIQAVIGVGVAVAVVVKGYWYKIKGLFSKNAKDDSKDLRAENK